MKTFRGHFEMLLKKLEDGEHIAYSRFSDGELRIMQNVELVLASGHCKIGKKVSPNQYKKEDHKHFIPSEHAFYREKLMEAYRFKKEKYFVGLSCRCCVGNSDFKQMLEWYDGDSESDNLTWANLFLNGNYPLFMEKIVPLFSKKKIVYILNENANTKNLPFEVVKEFKVGFNCFVNNYDMIEEIKEWIKKNDIEDHIFLFSASSLSNLMIHQLFDFCDKNAYLDIGTTLNPMLGMQAKRGYHTGNKKMCIW